jgi:hypothetical protein
VVAVVGTRPVRCPVGTLEQLRESFPDGWAPAAVDVALERLRSGTRERWIYSLDPDEPSRCEVAEEGRTEIGVGPDGRVLWYVAITGKTFLVLPEEYAPSGLPAPAGT